MRIEHVVSKLSFAIEGARIFHASDEVVHFVLPHIFSLHCIMFPAFVASFIEDHYMLSSVGLRPLRHAARLYHGLFATRAALSRFLQRYENNMDTAPFQTLRSLHREYHAARLQQLFLREVLAILMQIPKRCICVAGRFCAFVSTLSTQHPAPGVPMTSIYSVQKQTAIYANPLLSSTYKASLDIMYVLRLERIFFYLWATRQKKRACGRQLNQGRTTIGSTLLLAMTLIAKRLSLSCSRVMITHGIYSMNEWLFKVVGRTRGVEGRGAGP